MKAGERINAALQRFSLLHHKKIDLGLDRMCELLVKAGDPHLSLPPVVHVAGSNGKGSTIAFVKAMAIAQGLTVHVHTSPHLIRLNERYIIAGKEMSDETLADLLEEVEAINDNAPATEFELLCLAMFIAFSRTAADLAIIEVGLGGELDATNVIAKPALCLITPISIEHSDWLGNDIAGIAKAKAGIIKHQCPVISAAQLNDVKDVFERIAYRQKAELKFLSEDISCLLEDARLVWSDETQLLDLPLPALKGSWQVQNAGLAIAAAVHFGWTEEAIAKGLQQVTWPGRLQRLSGIKQLPFDTEGWLDGAHNPHAAIALSGFIRERNRIEPLRLEMILSMQATKDLSGFLQPFKEFEPIIHLVPLLGARAPITVNELTQQVLQLGFTAKAHHDLNAALMSLSKDKTRLLITGSLYLVGEVLNLRSVNS
ncbi:MAG: bifunctional folylpolyglutamate synthase/dihydrofolate synthase [Robiginitomaculum sp.]|nr:bifunctional folylpolyglutamate synthase/dihydrofolate synthase [Robiginitomaculum sp.]